MSSIDEAVSGAQRSWLPTGVLVLSTLGVLISSYLTYEHVTSSTSFACPETGTINCVKVTTSTYSELLGVPVAFLGLGFYLAMTAMSLPAMWRRPSIGRIRLAAAALGVVFVVYLMWVELFQIDAICLWCTAVHLLTVLIFALLATYEALNMPALPADPAK